MVQLVGQIGNLALGVVVTAVLARALGEERYGEWTTIFLVVGLVGYFNDLGLQQVAVQRAVVRDEAQWVGGLVSLRLLLSLPTTLATVVVVAVLASGSEMRLAGLVICAQLLASGPAALATAFKVRVRNDLTIAIMTVNSVLWTAAVIAIAAAGHGLVAFAVAFTAISWVTTSLQVALALRIAPVRLRGNRGRWRELLRVGIPVSISAVLVLSYSRIDGVIVYEAAGASAAGLYGAAYRVLEQSHFVPMSLMTTMFPIIAGTYDRDRDRARRLLQLALEYLTIGSLPALAFALAASGPAIRLLYGADFAPAAGALRVLMIAFVLICFGYGFSSLTLVLGLQRVMVRYTLAALVLNVALNLVLVPRYGFLAAAWATVATEALVTTLMARAILRGIEMRPRVGRMLRAAVAAAAMGAIVGALAHAGVAIYWLMLVAAASYGALLFALRALTPADVAFLRGARGAV